MTSRTPIGAALAALLAAAACGSATTPTSLPVTLTCPADVHVGSVASTTANVSFALPTASGGKPPIGVTCSPASGSQFPLGTTAVSCTGTDGSHSASCAFAVTLVPPQPVLSVKNFVAFGDSITAGENGEGSFALIDSTNAYPSQLFGLLMARYTTETMEMANCGIQGETASQGAARIDHVMSFYNPDAVLLFEGVNDLVGDINADSRALQDALGTDIETAKAHAVAGVFMSTLLPEDAMERRGVHASEIASINDYVRAIGAQHGAVIVDNYTSFLGHPEYLDEDGLHPLPIGNQVIAQNFFNAIQSKFESLQPTGLTRRVSDFPVGPSALCPNDKLTSIARHR